MRKAIVLISWAMILLLSLPASPAGASSPPLAVNFEVETTIDGAQPSHGPFTASGPAVDAGMICATGQTIDVFVRAMGFRSVTGINFYVFKRFTCDDGSGDFLVKLEVRVDQRGDNFNWVIIEGTGNYVKLHGTGQGVGLSTDYGVLDLFKGAAHID